MIAFTCERIARAVLGEPHHVSAGEAYFTCPNHEDTHPSLKINLKKNLFLCGPCGKGGKAWALAAFLARLDPGDKPGVTAWLSERALLDGSTNGSDTPGSATRGKKRVAEFYYSPDLRKVRLEPGDNGKPKMFVWEHREGDTWKPGDGGKVKLLYANKIFCDADQLDYAVGFEGEAKCDLAGELGIPGFSYKDMGGSECKKLEGLKIVLWRDKDAAGEKQVQDAAQKIHRCGHPRSIEIIVPPTELPPGGDIVDAVKTLVWGRAEVESLIRMALKWEPNLRHAVAAEQNPGAVVRCFANIAPEPLSWLWPGRIPLGKITLLIGDPGLGKSLVTVDIASRSSRGTAFPDGAVCKVGDVILLSAEDDPADTIRPRLDAAAADISRVHVLEAVRVPCADGSLLEKGFSLETDIAALEDVLNRLPDVRLIVIDPISAYLGGADSNTNAEVRGLLVPLATLAAKHAVAILCITHLRKSNGPAVHRAISSIAFAAAARAVWAVACDPSDSERRLMLAVKQNLGPNVGGLAFRVITQNGLPRLDWESGALTMDANDVLKVQDHENHPEQKETQEWLREYLADGPVGAREAIRAANDVGITRTTLWRAADSLEVVKRKIGGRGAGWEWSLKESSTTHTHVDSLTTQVKTKADTVARDSKNPPMECGDPVESLPLADDANEDGEIRL